MPMPSPACIAVLTPPIFKVEQLAIETSTYQQIHQDDWHGQEEDEKEDERGLLVRHHGSERLWVFRIQVVDQ